MNITQALENASRTIPPREARLLFEYAIGLSAAQILTHPERTLSADETTRFNEWITRRAKGEPIAYLLGEREFYSLRFHTTPNVLIPRPETELLVDIAVAKGKHPSSTPYRMLDLGTGSGCIAISIAKHLPHAEIVAADASLAALALARQNAALHDVAIQCVHSDWFSALTGQRFDLIVTNPPYIAAADPHLSQGDLRFEPLSALASGLDGLDAIRHIIASASQYLLPEGAIYIEHGYDQAETVATLFNTHGFSNIEHHTDLAGIIRVTGAYTNMN